MKTWIIAAFVVISSLVILTRLGIFSPNETVHHGPPESSSTNKTAGGNPSRTEESSSLPNIIQEYQSGMTSGSHDDPSQSPQAHQSTTFDESTHLGRLQIMLHAGTATGEELGGLVLAALKDLEGAERQEFLTKSTALMVDEDPELLQGVLPLIPAMRDRYTILNTAIDQLIQSDPNDAVDWVAGLEAGGSRKSATEILAREWAQSDLTGAQAWVESLPPGSPEAIKANEGLVWTWMQQDPQAVVDYANALEDPVAQKHAFDKAAKMLALKEPSTAVAWATEFPDAEQRRELIDFSLYRWAREDPEAAGDWLESMEDEAVRTGAASGLVRAWADTDPAGATQWMMENRDSVYDEVSLLNTTRQWARKDPGATATWLQGINDPQLQNRIMDNIMRSSLEGGRETVDAWMGLIEDPGLRARGESLLGQE